MFPAVISTAILSLTQYNSTPVVSDSSESFAVGRWVVAVSCGTTNNLFWWLWLSCFYPMYSDSNADSLPVQT
ncbi:hypothetical protein C8J57DRAFT_1266016 [Mycena rebaudengoi]|nr:hypothetical protein C8J57DRAFT_1380040 [Mycena rebaudengoi]KAJ7292481.1 hypothetical protein C8J57DRAFT_1266016 [Mycena rebaudengoi]